MKSLTLVASILVTLLLACSCAKMSDEPTAVMLQHPETMKFVKCEVDQWGTKKSYAKNEQCVEDYQSQGYVIWGER